MNIKDLHLVQYICDCSQHHGMFEFGEQYLQLCYTENIDSLSESLTLRLFLN